MLTHSRVLGLAPDLSPDINLVFFVLGTSHVNNKGFVRRFCCILISKKQKQSQVEITFCSTAGRPAVVSQLCSACYYVSLFWVASPSIGIVLRGHVMEGHATSLVPQP